METSAGVGTWLDIDAFIRPVLPAFICERSILIGDAPSAEIKVLRFDLTGQSHRGNPERAIDGVGGIGRDNGLKPFVSDPSEADVIRVDTVRIKSVHREVGIQIHQRYVLACGLESRHHIGDDQIVSFIGGETGDRGDFSDNQLCIGAKRGDLRNQCLQTRFHPWENQHVVGADHQRDDVGENGRPAGSIAASEPVAAVGITLHASELEESGIVEAIKVVANILNIVGRVSFVIALIDRLGGKCARSF